MKDAPDYEDCYEYIISGDIQEKLESSEGLFYEEDDGIPEEDLFALDGFFYE